MVYMNVARKVSFVKYLQNTTLNMNGLDKHLVIGFFVSKIPTLFMQTELSFKRSIERLFCVVTLRLNKLLKNLFYGQS